MRYLKKFEGKLSEDEDRCWEVTLLRPYFNLSLKKIGVPDDLISDWDEMYNNEDFYVYIYKEKVKNYDKLRDDYDISVEWRLEFVRNHRFIFMGNVKIRDFEIDSNKFNI